MEQLQTLYNVYQWEVIRQVSADYTVPDSAYATYVTDITSGSVTITIPVSVLEDNLQISVKKVVDSLANVSNWDTNHVTITTDDTDNYSFNLDWYPVDTITITVTGQCLLLHYDEATSTFYVK